MALHHELPIYKQAYDLLGLATDLTKNIPRDIKVSLGRKISDECCNLLVLIARANAAKDKTPHIESLVESNDVISFLLRILCDKRHISVEKHAHAIEVINSIGRQATAWKKKQCRPA